MKLGSFEIPDLRLIPNTTKVLDEIYSVKKKQKIQSKELAIHLGYKYGTETHFYRKLKSLIGYGLIVGSGSYQVSELGETLLHSKTEDEKSFAKTKAIMNVRLWKEIFDKSGKNPREDNFWAVLVDITKIDPVTAKKEQSKILKWYLDDFEHITDKYVEKEEFGSQDQHLTQSTTQNNQMSQQVELPQISSLGQLTIPTMGTIQINDNDTLTIARTYLNALEKKMKEPKPKKVENATDESEFE